VRLAGEEGLLPAFSVETAQAQLGIMGSCSCAAAAARQAAAAAALAQGHASRPASCPGPTRPHTAPTLRTHAPCAHTPGGRCPAPTPLPGRPPGNATEYSDLLARFASYVAQHAQQLPSVLWRETAPQHYDAPGGAYNSSAPDLEGGGGYGCVPLRVRPTCGLSC
jgi:hypothetical protein